MYINPFLAGAISIVMVEMMLLIGVAVFKAYTEKGDSND